MFRSDLLGPSVNSSDRKQYAINRTCMSTMRRACDMAALARNLRRMPVLSIVAGHCPGTVVPLHTSTRER